MFFPLADDDRALVKPAYVTWILVGLNIAAFVYQIEHEPFSYGYSVIPWEITHGTDLVEPVLVPVGPREAISIPHAPGPWPIYLTLLTSMFLHGGLGHLGGNLLYLWIFGDNVEHRFGHLPFLAFYVISGLAAAAAQILTAPDAVVPMLGASGAISGVLGAYLVLFPRNMVHTIVLFYVTSIPAAIVIVVWAVTQAVSGYGTLIAGTSTGGVAYMAHLGGFAAGVAMALYCRRKWKCEAPSVFTRVYAANPRERIWW
jgi:membrane associated rhomboid family serine protease